MIEGEMAWLLDWWTRTMREALPHWPTLLVVAGLWAFVAGFVGAAYAEVRRSLDRWMYRRWLARRRHSTYDLGRRR